MHGFGGLMVAQLTECARSRGCDEKAVRKAVRQERTSAIERDGKRFIGLEAAFEAHRPAPVSAFEVSMAHTDRHPVWPLPHHH